MYEPQLPQEGDAEKTQRERAEHYIRSFEGPAESILDQLDADIQKGRYSHVLGIDTSGRIPARIVGGYIAELYKRDKRTLPEHIFAMPSHSGDSTPQLAELVAQADRLRKEGKKVLVVEDTLYRGNSIKDATQMLRTYEIPFDIAVFLGVNKDAEDIERFRVALGAEKMCIGEYVAFSDDTEGDEHTPIVKDKDLSGVIASDEKHTPVTVNRGVDPKLIAYGREEINKMVEDLIVKHDKIREG